MLLSGLPEFRFDEGFSTFEIYCLEVGSPFLNYYSFGVAVVSYKEVGLDCTNMMFMLNEAIRLKDGQGSADIATYLGPVEHSKGIRHKIAHKDGTDFLVDGIFLSPAQAPAIASVPIEVEQLASELPNLSKTQLNQIAYPKILNSDQRALMVLHCKMNHLPFLALICLAEVG